MANVSEQEKYGMNTLAMVDALVAPSTTLVRPEPETFQLPIQIFSFYRWICKTVITKIW